MERIAHYAAGHIPIGIVLICGQFRPCAVRNGGHIIQTHIFDNLIFFHKMDDKLFGDLRSIRGGMGDTCAEQGGCHISARVMNS
jgi:hypothetical protein